MRVFNRLYLKVYATVVVTLLLTFLVSVAIWSTGPEFATARGAFGMASGLASAALGDPHASQLEQLKSLRSLAKLLEADLAVYDKGGALVGHSGAVLPPPSDIDDNRQRPFSRNPIWKFRLMDGRIIVVRPPLQRHVHSPSFLLHVAVVAFLLALGSFPVVRGLTRRLERLQQGVETLGAGDLSVRVKVEGKDEVARVAESFNRAAGRIEELVNAHKMLLANASHELRTPLTRLRLGIETLKLNAGDKTRADLEQDISELDQLIEEILLTSRLGTLQRLEVSEEIDLLALAAEEAARYDEVSVSGTSLTVQGDARLLRRVIRNLLDNAIRYGLPPIELSVAAGGENALMQVKDHGPGIAAADRDRIFEPFIRVQTSAPQEKSAGLGLALVRQIARLHGGDASVSEGSTFSVSLPRCGI